MSMTGTVCVHEMGHRVCYDKAMTKAIGLKQVNVHESDINFRQLSHEFSVIVHKF